MSRFHSYLLVSAAIALLSASSTIGHAREVDEVDERLKKVPAGQLMVIVSDTAEAKMVRWRATAELARRKDPAAKPLFIRSLNDDYHSVRGAAAWGLSQIGGKDAQDALLAFLKTSLASRNWGDLTRATEAEKELPDRRAVDLLVQCLNIPKEQSRNYHFRYYAAEALGAIGDSKASLALGQQLDLSVDYGHSRDYLYLAAIRQTKGKEVIPILIDYLRRLVVKMDGQDLRQYWVTVGRESRQVHYNFKVYGLALSTLEAIAERKADSGASREDVVKDWQKWWRGEASRRLDQPQKE